MSQGSTVFQRIMCVPGEHVVPGKHVCSRVHMWGQKAFVVAVLSFHCVCPRDRTQVIRLGNKPPPEPSH